MLTPILDSGGESPLYEQLYRQLRGEIESGRLAAGEKLPSKRSLAAHLRVSVVTVEGADGAGPNLIAQAEEAVARCYGLTLSS